MTVGNAYDFDADMAIMRAKEEKEKLANRIILEHSSDGVILDPAAMREEGYYNEKALEKAFLRIAELFCDGDQRAFLAKLEEHNFSIEDYLASDDAIDINNPLSPDHEKVGDLIIGGKIAKTPEDLADIIPDKEAGKIAGLLVQQKLGTLPCETIGYLNEVMKESGENYREHIKRLKESVEKREGEIRTMTKCLKLIENKIERANRAVKFNDGISYCQCGAYNNIDKCVWCELTEYIKDSQDFADGGVIHG
jgi:hypothetical protein